MNPPPPANPAPAPPHPAPESADKFNRLKALLREMFQLDRGDLDFGLYRIMNMKAREVSTFLDNDLLPQVKTILGGIADEERAAREKELEQARAAARELGFEPDESPKVAELKERMAEARTDAKGEADVYNHLANFFGRYYEEGDFMSQRRYTGGGDSAYMIPYDGEEVKLHWANADQYYVKTTENYASYIFTVGDSGPPRRVRFEITAADNEKDNVKAAAGKQRRFVLASGPGAVAIDGANITVRFEHRPLTDSEKKAFPGNGGSQQRRMNAATTERVLAAVDIDWRARLAAPAPTDSCPERTLLGKHVERYTAKNSFDYFIHKDLGGFLRRELDFYLKNEVLNLDDLARGDSVMLDRTLARMRAVRGVAEKIIAFLAQLEDFQKKLWLKKKFVLETQWCVTLDRVPEELYPEIAANEAQRDEWVELFAINEIADERENDSDASGGPPLLREASARYFSETDRDNTLTVRFLKANPYLVLDTRHFSRDFTDRLLAALSDAGPLDEQTDGLLVHGENFQALELLQTRYGGKIDCIYIDPPYNTGDSEILYKNGYLRSSWLSLMSDRLTVMSKLSSTNAVVFIAIDDFEMVNLAKLLDTEHPSLRRETIIVNHHPQGGKAKTLAHTHEYMFACFSGSSDKQLVGKTTNNDAEERRFKRSGTAMSNFRYGRPNSFYAILVDPDSHRVVGLERPPAGDDYPRGPTGDNHIRIYPFGAQGEERVWRRAYESCKELIHAGKLVCKGGNTIYHVIEPDERRPALFSNWTDSRYNAGVHGANLLGEITGSPNSFSYPKSVHTVGDAIFSADLDADANVLDYFAGSGTTGHATIMLNREDGLQRRYILVELGPYFDTVLLPRIKKIVYSPDWKGGKPVSREGLTQLFKYVRLESYEDALDSLDRIPPPDDLLARQPDLEEDYKLRYALGVETAESASLLGKHFTDPFAYSLSAVREGARCNAPVDLPETFNFLLGLRVRSRRRIDSVLVIDGTDAERRNCLILWRNADETDNDALNVWFAHHRRRFGERLDLVYANGDHTLNAIRRPGETWEAVSIEPVFRELMFEDGANGD